MNMKLKNVFLALHNILYAPFITEYPQYTGHFEIHYIHMKLYEEIHDVHMDFQNVFCI